MGVVEVEIVEEVEVFLLALAEATTISDEELEEEVRSGQVACFLGRK